MNPINTTFQDSHCPSNDKYLVDEKRAVVVDLSTKAPVITSMAQYQPCDQTGLLKLPFSISTSLPMQPPASSSTRTANHISKPLAYCTPNPVPNLPENNQVRLLEYRGAQLAAFTVDGRDLVCLPQAFELFLKHLVGGLHTVYTKLKRLEIAPVVCNVEQVRILRGLGAIQPGVNRCKLIAPNEFDVLYADCTNSSARPGRPSKRISAVSSPTSTTIPTSMTSDIYLNGQYCSMVKEPPAKYPRKFFPDQACLSRSSTFSRLPSYSSVPMPYPSALASLCLNPDNVGRLFSDNEPFLQAMTSLSNAFTPSTTTTFLSHAPPRIPFLPDTDGHISTSPNMYMESERPANGNLMSPQSNHIHVSTYQEQNETRQRSSGNSEALYKLWNNNKSTLPNPVRHSTASENGQSHVQKPPSSEIFTDSSEIHSLPADHRDFQTTFYDWLKMIPSLKPSPNTVHGGLPLPFSNNNPLQCSTSSPYPGTNICANTDHDPWMIHSKRLAEPNSTWTELTSRLKLPMPMLFPTASTGFPCIPSTISDQTSNFALTDSESVMNSAQGEQLPNRTSSHPEITPPRGEDKSSNPDVLFPCFSGIENGKDKPDQFRTCFDSMFYRILESYYQMIHATKPSETPPSVAITVTSEANFHSERVGLESQLKPNVSTNPSSMCTPFLDLTLSQGCFPFTTADQGPMQTKAVESQSNSPDSQVKKNNPHLYKSKDINSLVAPEDVFGVQPTSQFAKTESPANRNLDNSNSSRRPISDCMRPWSASDLFQNSSTVSTSHQPEDSTEVLNRDLSVRHYQWLQLMVKSFMANYHSGATKGPYEEGHKQEASDEYQDQSDSP